MKENRSLGGFFNWTFLGLFLVGLVLVNIIASLLYFRIDMTEDKRYSLAEGTVNYEL